MNKQNKMKREIKFRGKRLDNGDWIYGSLIACENYTDIWCVGKDGHVIREEVDHNTVGQYTGIDDSFHDEIYEWDILRLGNRVYRVEWDDENGSWYAVPMKVGKGSNYCLDGADFVNTDNIGNIFDDPDI